MTRFFSRGSPDGRWNRPRSCRTRREPGERVRYLVTGAAGFIGSHLSEALRDAGPRRRRHRLLHRLLRRRAEGGERAREGDPSARPRRAIRSTSAASTASSTLPGSPECELRRRLSETYLRPERARVAAALRGRGRATACASSSRRPRRSTARPRRIRRRDTPPQPIVALRHHEARCEHLARADARSFGLDVVVLRYFNVYGPRQRPDMAFTRIVDVPRREAARSTSSATGSSRAASPTSATSSRGTIAGDGRRAAARTTSAAARRRRCATTIAIFEELAGRPLEVREHPSRPGRPAAHEGRHDADPPRARLGADDVAWGRSLVPSGSGPLLGSRRDEREQRARSRRRARGRSAFRVDADHRALVAAGRRARDRRHSRRARLGRRRRRLTAPGRCSTSGSRSRPRAAARSRASRRTRRPSARSSAREAALRRAAAASGLTLGQLRGNVTSAAIVSAGQGKNVIAARRDHGRRGAAPQGGEGGRLARRLGHRASSRPTSTRRSSCSTSRSSRARPSSPTSTRASRTRSRSSRP